MPNLPPAITTPVVRPFTDAYLQEYSYHVRYEFDMFEWLVERFGTSLGLRLSAPTPVDVQNVRTHWPDDTLSGLS
jgi:hypothetical protein